MMEENPERKVPTMSDTATLSPQADTAARTLRNYVGGAWRAPKAADSIEDRNPATGELLARVPLSGAADVDEAVAGAHAAAGEWARVSPLVRMRAVFRLREVLDEHREELAQLVTKDMGKTLADARGEVGRGIESVEAACGLPHVLKGESLSGVA
jgi:malonate-semialdehyde dehydrogenase (acetylating)/methylmalonate-semialdehyde dehydrogenase